MNRKEYLGVLGVAVMAGLVGGIISENLFQTVPAIKMERVIAQETSHTAKLITAEEFRLVDQDGWTRAVLGMDPEGTSGFSEPFMALYNKEGESLARFRLRGFFPVL